MKQFKLKFCIVLALLFVAVVCFYGKEWKVFALDTTDNLHLHTKIYSSHNNDYFDGCEDYANYVNSAPTITVLTHGLDSAAYYWSNDYSFYNGSEFAYNSSSLINKIYEHLDGQMTLYKAAGIKEESTGGFELKKYSYEDYINSNDGKITSVIDDVSKHIVIVYNSSVSGRSNYTVYNEFHTILDNISAQYKNLTGVLPRFNLVGHSRGGITNIMYASEHPYNVASVFSMGAPYSGSALGELEILLAMMGYADKETYEVTNEGVINGTKYATIYNSNGSLIASVTTSGTNKAYSFTLSAGQTCYVIYSNTDSSITSNLYINPTQLRWKVDDELYDTNHIQLPRGDSYTIELVVLYNEEIVDYTSPYVNTSSTYFVFSNNILSIDEGALIGYDITIYPTLAPDYLLTVQIGYGNEFSWNVSNGNNVTL